MVDLLLECEVKIPQEQIDMIKTAAETVLTFEKHGFDAEISVILTDNDGIKTFNREYRNIDSSTDVLSFPLYEFETPSVFNDKELSLENGAVVLGDIIISLEKIISQAKEYGHSFERELSYMTVHSMLHLLGYDHMTDKDKTLMRNKEDEIMKILDLNR